MKSVYIVELSEDGLDIYVYSNIKALYNGLNEISYQKETIGLGDDVVKYSYANLVKQLRKSSQGGKYYERAFIGNNSGYANITITQTPIKTK